MAREERVDIVKLQGYNCFACGTANPIGLNLQFYRLGNAICSDIMLGKNHEGWENMAHGGIISTLIDEVMSWAMVYFRRTFFVTRKMDMKYVRPVLIGTPLTVKGMLDGDSKGPKIKARGEIRDDEGRLLVKSAGEFAVIPHDRLSSVPEGLKKDMRLLFQRLGENEGGLD
jgi:acyl-coenzyme A thioesterase PaaI-like protein